MQRALDSLSALVPPVPKPTLQSPVELLNRLKNGGVTEWRKMSFAEKMRLISEYGNGSEAEFMKQFKILTGKDLDLRTEATAQERLDPRQAMEAAGLNVKPLTGGSPRLAYGILVKSRKRKTRVRKNRDRNRKSRTQKHQGYRK
jgi:hypothetical protein